MLDLIVIDIADMKASNGSTSLVTYALGSCIGVSCYDPDAKAGALLHYMLPESQLDARKALERPYMFADSGIPRMFQALRDLGCKGNRLIVKAAGGANVMDPNGVFNIGKRNHLALKKILWKFNILLKGEDVGGNVSRNMTLDLSTGETRIRYSGCKDEVKI